MKTEELFPTELDELAFLLEEVPRALRRRFDEKVQAYGLSRTQWRVIAYTLRNEGLTQSDLARCLELERMTIGLTLAKMEASGLIERRFCDQDRRARRVYTTSKARDLVPELRHRADSTYAELLAGLSQSETRRLRALLSKVADNLRDPNYRD